ncbi:hypothetical protein MHK_000054 [Candidatus Magnetomorum sp. HK-1]|nr:hypothetical protein MHK_000054 [Candidatus Magnetomorum sp. HK-1]
MKNIMHPGQYLKTKYIDTQQKTIKSLANELDIAPKMNIKRHPCHFQLKASLENHG